MRGPTRDPKAARRAGAARAIHYPVPRPAAWRGLRGAALLPSLALTLAVMLTGLAGCGESDEAASAAGRATTHAAERPGDASASGEGFG